MSDTNDLPELMIRCLQPGRGGRYDTDEPFVVDGYIYCTDSTILSRMACEYSDTQDRHLPPVDKYAEDFGRDVTRWVSAEGLLRDAVLLRSENLARLAVPLGALYLSPFYAAMVEKWGGRFEADPPANRPVRWRKIFEDGDVVDGVLMPLNVNPTP